MKKVEDTRKRWYEPGEIRTPQDLMVWHQKFARMTRIRNRRANRRIRQLFNMVIERNDLIAKWHKLYNEVEDYARSVDMAVNVMTEKLVELDQEETVLAVVEMMRKIRGEI